jgi:hypothetical protein
MYWSSPLDNLRAQGVNPITNAEYFEVLKEVQEDYDVPDELVYGEDETGIQIGNVTGLRTRAGWCHGCLWVRVWVGTL